MTQIHVREGRSEVLIYLDRHVSDDLQAIEEAAKLLGREVTRANNNIGPFARRASNSNQLQSDSGSNG